MNRNPSKRLGAGSKDAKEIKAHPFFAGVLWEEIYQRKAKLPKPALQVLKKADEGVKIWDSPAVEGINKVEGWSFVEGQ